MKKLLLIVTLLVSLQANAILSRMANVMPVTRIAMQQARFAHCHNVLGVATNASKKEIKAAFASKIKKMHPDHNKNIGVQKEVQSFLDARKKALSLIKSDNSSGFSAEEKAVLEQYMKDFFAPYEESLFKKSYNDARNFGEKYAWKKQMMNWGEKTIIPSKANLILTKSAATAASFPAMITKNIGSKIWRKIKDQ